MYFFELKLPEFPNHHIQWPCWLQESGNLGFTVQNYKFSKHWLFLSVYCIYIFRQGYRVPCISTQRYTIMHKFSDILNTVHFYVIAPEIANENSVPRNSSLASIQHLICNHLLEIKTEKQKMITGGRRNSASHIQPMNQIYYSSFYNSLQESSLQLSIQHVLSPEPP